MNDHGSHQYDLVGEFSDECPACLEDKALRDKLALIEVTVALWEAGAVEMEKEIGVRAKASQSQRRLRVAARVNRSHAEVIRDILKGE